MKREEVTPKILRDMGFKPTKDYEKLDDIVFNLQENEYWKYLRLRTDENNIYSEKEYGMCSTYKIFMKREYFEVSSDKKIWHSVMYRYVEFKRVCVWAE